MPYTSPNQDKDLGLLKAFVFSALLAGCSNTGDMEFQPVDKDLTNKQLGQNVTLAILSFPDKRPPVKGFAWSKKTVYQTREEFGLVRLKIVRR